MTEMPDTETGAAFAAGVATAEAGQAREEASTAAIRADIATERAEDAERAAGAAIETSWATREAVDELAAQIRDEMDSIRELITSKAGGEGENGDGRSPAGETAPEPGAVPAPERKGDDKPAPVVEDTGEKPKRRNGYGSRTWFGD